MDAAAIIGLIRDSYQHACRMAERAEDADLDCERAGWRELANAWSCYKQSRAHRRRWRWPGKRLSWASTSKLIATGTSQTPTPTEQERVLSFYVRSLPDE